MISSLEKFQSKFVEEALDNIEDLEQTLMLLERSSGDNELLEKVFRIMHSLKGGGAMFGFEQLSDFAHHLENMYELVRSGSIKLSSGILSVTFRSVDLMRSMLLESGSGLSSLLDISREIIKEITDVISETDNAENFTPVKKEPIVDNGMNTWYIYFRPGKNVLANGINLLYLLDELKNLGSLFAIPRGSSVPAFDSFQPEDTYFHWDLFLSTEEAQNDIKDVFLFVEGESEIFFHHIARENLMGNDNFLSHLHKIKKDQDPVEISILNGFASPKKSQQLFNSASDNNGPDPSLTEVISNGRATKSIRVAFEKVDQLMDLVSEMVITQERLNLISTQHPIPELKMVSDNVQKITTLLRDSTFNLSLVPVESLMTRFQRLVRDLSRRLNKEIDFSVSGADTELDKSMIDGLADPLMHILRNAIDHGIEDPDTRVLSGKSKTGKIIIKAEYSGVNIVFQITDDGAGIDLERLRHKAVEKGLISPSASMSEQELLELVFLPGFSTNNDVTEMSGRGVGMDVVKRNIEAIRGETSIHSALGVGTTVIITIPMVLSIIDGLLVSIEDTKYVVPLSVVDRIFSVDSSRLQDAFLDVATLNGQQVPFVDLRKAIGLENAHPPNVEMVVVVQSGKYLALSVDKVIGNIQAVLKPLGTHYQYQKMVSAATIMGDGSIGLVLDINHFFSN